MSIFIAPLELADLLNLPNVRIVDGSWYMPAMRRDAAAEYLASHIPGAVRFDIDAIADHSTNLPHMLPDEATFGEAAGRLGLSPADRIIVYDGLGLFSAPRVRWTLKFFGAREVHILNGGFPAWKAAGLPVESGPATPRAQRFRAHANGLPVVTYKQLVEILEHRSADVLDARSPGRFLGSEPEPRAGLSSGHMPGAINLPFNEVIANGTLKPRDELLALFAGKGIDPARPIVTSCGSGVTAAVIALALEAVGAADVALYDGSWSEWAATPDAKIAKG